MMANKIQIGMMGDYPLIVNGATGQDTKNDTQLVAVTAYNAYGGGNGERWLRSGSCRRRPGPRANLVRSDRHCLYGIVASATHQELGAPLHTRVPGVVPAEELTATCRAPTTSTTLELEIVA
jgi:hypothetical protein